MKPKREKPFHILFSSTLFFYFYIWHKEQQERIIFNQKVIVLNSVMVKFCLVEMVRKSNKHGARSTNLKVRQCLVGFGWTKSWLALAF
jgi:hypothetical protein